MFLGNVQIAGPFNNICPYSHAIAREGVALPKHRRRYVGSDGLHGNTPQRGLIATQAWTYHEESIPVGHETPLAHVQTLSKPP